METETTTAMAGSLAVSALCACTTLKSTDWSKNATAAFQVGLRCALDDWDVLRTAIQDGWAGSDRIGHMFRNDLHASLVRYFADTASPDADDIAVTLAEFMSSKFSCDLEDDSIDWIAALSMHLHNDCQGGDFSGLRMLIDRNPSPPSLIAIARGQPQPDHAPKCDCQVTAGDERPSERRPKATIESDQDDEAPGLVDEDGWQTVTSKKSSRRKRPQ